MRVCFTSFYEKPSMGGGIGRVAHELPRAFAKQGYDVLFFCMGKKTALIKESEHLTIAYIKSENQGELSIPQLGPTTIHFVYKQLRQFQPQVIHSQDFDPLSLLAQIWAIIHGVVFFHTIHFFPTRREKFGMDDYSKPLAYLYGSAFVSRYIHDYYDGSDALIALNEFVEEDIKNFGYLGKIITIPNGRDMSVYNALSLADTKAKTRELLFAGFLSTRKNQEYLIEMMKYLPKQYHLTLLGDAFNSKYKQQLLKFIKTERPNVTIKDKVSHEELIRYLEKTHIFVSASIMELQSLIILEALGSGTPVVGLINETIDEFVDDTVGYKLLPHTSPQNFATYVEKIGLLSQNQYEKLCLTARVKVAHLDWSFVVDEMVEAYQQTIKTKKVKDQKKRFEIITRLTPIFTDSQVVSTIREYAREFMDDLFPRWEAKEKRKLLKPKKQYLYILFAIPATVGLHYLLNLFHRGKTLKKKMKDIT